ncbi:hypothetical protein BH23PLA1_BH23PLA1_39690 [soil metagenome]
MKRFIAATPLAIVALIVAGAATQDQDQAKHESGHDEIIGAVAVLIPSDGSEVRGLVVFLKEEDGIRVQGQIIGLSPGKHGFHVHEFGDLRSPDGTAAGDHFNPTDGKHAGREADERHVGDLGNIEADEQGIATFDFLDEKLSFEGKTSILGRGLVVHADADDLKSQPSGDAGGRVAVGVIGVANPAPLEEVEQE